MSPKQPPEQPSTTTQETSSPPSHLAQQFKETTYRELFQLSGGQASETLWRQLDPGHLTALLNDADADTQAVFLAAELAARYDQALWRSADRAVLAQAYGQALAQDYVGMANPWGLPKTIGPLGERLLELGEAVVPMLMANLSNDDAVTYAGSEEASIGNAYRFRVKDLAAYYLALIRAEVFIIDKDPAARDDEIAQLRGRL